MKISLVAMMLAGSLLAQQQSALTDSKLMGLAQAGVSEGELLRMVNMAAEFDFDLRPESTAAMMKSGISEDVIKAMAAKESRSAMLTPPTPSHPATQEKLVGPPRLSSSNPRVFVMHSNDSWIAEGGKSSTHPQTVELMKTFAESCPSLVVTQDPEKAEYRVQFERESSKLVRRHNKFAAFNKNGDLVYASSTRELGNAVRGFCAAIR